MFVSVGGSKLELRAIISIDQNVNQRIEANGDFIDDPTSETRTREAYSGSEAIQFIRGASASTLLLQFVFTYTVRLTAVGCHRRGSIALLF